LAPSINKTTAPINNDKVVKSNWSGAKKFLPHDNEMDSALMIVYSKIDLSDGFWRTMIALVASQP
jgi:hypothetical protein